MPIPQNLTRLPLSLLTILFIAISYARSASAAAVNVNCQDLVGDTSTLQAAINGSQNGDEILIHGTCLINQTIVLLGNRSYLGDSRTGTIIQQANGSNLTALLASDSWAYDYTYTGSPFRIADLTLDGNSSGNSGTSDLVIRSWMTVIEDLQIENSAADGMQITSVSKNGVPLTTSQVNGRMSNLMISNSGGNGVHVIDSVNAVTDWDLLDSWIASSGQSAIYMENAAGWKIRGNHLFGVPQHGIYANACFATAIEGNYIEEFGASGGSGNTWYGIACTVQGGAASVIANNKIFQLNGEPSSGNFVYIGVPQQNYGGGELNVMGNVIRGVSGKNNIGLSYEAGDGVSLKVLSRSNNVQNAGTPRAVGKNVTLEDGY
jgi:hypothetical protein